VLDVLPMRSQVWILIGHFYGKSLRKTLLIIAHFNQILKTFTSSLCLAIRQINLKSWINYCKFIQVPKGMVVTDEAGCGMIQNKISFEVQHLLSLHVSCYICQSFAYKIIYNPPYRGSLVYGKLDSFFTYHKY